MNLNTSSITPWKKLLEEPVQSKGHAHPHMVQFYDGDAHLIESLQLFITAGLQKGEGIILVTTKPHADGIRGALLAADVDVDQVIASGQLTLLDAEETLAQFMVQGRPDRKRFDAVIGGLIDAKSERFPLIRAYGEMVAILWSQGNLEGTLSLEELWNDLAKSRRFSLLCGYVMTDFEDEQHGRAFHEICCTHSHVIPSENFTALKKSDTQLRLIAELQQKTMALQTEVAERRSMEFALRKIQEDLQAAKDAAESANLAKSRFLANMSHEIRSPLGAMLGFAELMVNRDVRAGELQEFVNTIVRNGKHLSRVIDSILDISKVESNHLEIETLEFSLRELIEDVASLLAPAAREKGISFNVSVHDDLPDIIKSDPTRLRQILVNLMTNAIKFTRRGGAEVKVRPLTTGKTGILQFVFKDTGIGIAADQVDRLFNPFVQADSSTTRKFGGTGLGLFLSRKLALALGGDLILADTQPDSGSTFIFTLPANVGHARPRALVSHPLPCRLDHKRILVVDDSEDNRTLIRLVLESMGARVGEADGGHRALLAVQSIKYDAILLDIQMPEMDGFETLAKLRAAGIQVPIMALTAHVMKSDQEQCRQAGFTDHIGKPLDRSMLTNVLRRHLLQ